MRGRFLAHLVPTPWRMACAMTFDVVAGGAAGGELRLYTPPPARHASPSASIRSRTTCTVLPAETSRVA